MSSEWVLQLLRISFIAFLTDAFLQLFPTFSILIKLPASFQQMTLPPILLRKLGSAIQRPSSLPSCRSSLPLHFCKCLSLPSPSSSFLLPPSQSDHTSALCPSILHRPQDFIRCYHSLPAPTYVTVRLSITCPSPAPSPPDTGLFRLLLSPEGVSFSLSSPHAHCSCATWFPPPPPSENIPWKVLDDLIPEPCGLSEALLPLEGTFRGEKIHYMYA